MAKQSNQSNSYKEILSDLQNKIYKPIYFLTGEESYYIDLISDYIQNNILDESQQVFDQFVLYGQDVDLTTVLEQARHFPMSAPYQVIIVKEAQCWKSLDELSSYLSSFQPQTILVICYKYKKADARKIIFCI
jgi:DNA polymerase-3 subunit delta